VRRTVVENPLDDPSVEIRNGLETRWNDDVLDGRVMLRRNDGQRVIEPDDSSFAVVDLGAFVIVCFEMSVRNCLRMVFVGFVQVLRRHDRSADKPRRQDQSRSRSRDTSRHGTIMAYLGRSGRCGLVRR
jgi:hypothetical protein